MNDPLSTEYILQRRIADVVVKLEEAKCDTIFDAGVLIGKTARDLRRLVDPNVWMDISAEERRVSVEAAQFRLAAIKQSEEGK